MINPQIVDTQQQGSIMQGIGAALYEELRYSEDGQLLSSTFMDYGCRRWKKCRSWLGAYRYAQSIYAVGRERRGRDWHARAPAGVVQRGGRCVKPVGVKIRDAAHAG